MKTERGRLYLTTTRLERQGLSLASATNHSEHLVSENNCRRSRDTSIILGLGHAACARAILLRMGWNIDMKTVF